MQESPDIWELLFQQTPRVMRWALGTATLGFFTLASLLWKWHRQDIVRMEKDAREYSREVHQRIDREMEHINDRLDLIYGAIIQSRCAEREDVARHERKSRARSERANPGTAEGNELEDGNEQDEGCGECRNM